MKIIDKNLIFSGVIKNRKETKKIVLHHSAGSGSVEAVHEMHKDNGYVGIGYHFYIDKAGDIYKGRAIGKIGAHAKGQNEDSIGICLEGNFEIEEPSVMQMEALLWLISYIEKIYGKLEIKKHSELGATLCPGKNFDLDGYKSVGEVVDGLILMGVVSEENRYNWEAFLSGSATPKADYIKTIIGRLYDKCKN